MSSKKLDSLNDNWNEFEEVETRQETKSNDEELINPIKLLTEEFNFKL